MSLVRDDEADVSRTTTHKLVLSVSGYRRSVLGINLQWKWITVTEGKVMRALPRGADHHHERGSPLVGRTRPATGLLPSSPGSGLPSQW